MGTAPSSSSISCDEILPDKNENDTAVDDIVEKKKTKVTVRYDPSIVLANSIIHNDDNDTELNNPFNSPPVNNNLFPATTTIGNVLDPKLHPTLPFLAYTATYAG